MTTYSAIPGTDIDTDSPITESLFTKLRDNPIAISEGSTGAPKVLTAAINDLAVTTAKIADDNVTLAKMADNSVTFAAEVAVDGTGSSWAVPVATPQVIPRGIYAIYPTPSGGVIFLEAFINAAWRIIQTITTSTTDPSQFVIGDGASVRLRSTVVTQTTFYTKLF